MAVTQDPNDLFRSHALETVTVSEPSAWIVASPELHNDTKTVSELLFSITGSYAVKCPLNKLLTDRFDAEQIWQQIDLQARPLLSTLRRRLGHFVKNTEFVLLETDDESDRKKSTNQLANGIHVSEGKNDGGVGSGMELSDSESEEGNERVEKSEDESLDEAGKSADDSDKDQGKEKRPVEDSFLKLDEMERFLDLADAEDSGIKPLTAANVGGIESGSEGGEEENDEEEVEEEEGDEEDGFEQMDDAFNYSAELVKNDRRTKTEQLRYEDFFGKTTKSKKPRDNLVPDYNSKDLSTEEMNEDVIEGNDRDKLDSGKSNAEVSKLSAHEKKLERIRKQVQLEKESLEPKSWTLQGEVTAAKRPKNSVLEVDLDFEHNVRPPPVITEEVTASLEELIKRRISEEQFDDVERKPRLPVPPPSIQSEIDENKSQKGLAEIYEAEYAQKTGLAVSTPSSTEKLKEEATILFKTLCAKLDALSHYHFAPKPIVEDLTVRADVPALAMEEVVPLAVSEASMLAPEEVFAGKGLVKEEKELTQSERKRRRAKKKRKFKAEQKSKEVAKRMRTSVIPSKAPSSRHAPENKIVSGHSSFTKSSKVFAELEKNKGRGVKIDKAEEKLHPSFLKL